MAKGKVVVSSGLNMKKGLNKSDIPQSSSSGKTFYLKKGEMKPIQFLDRPRDFGEYLCHQFSEDNRYKYIPCVGSKCPLCKEDDERSKRRKRWCCNIYSPRDGRVLVLEFGPQLAATIIDRYERKPKNFRMTVYDLTKMATTPVTYDLIPADDRPMNKDFDLHDLEEYLQEQVDTYYNTGNEKDLEDDDEEEAPKSKKSRVEEEDDDDDDDDFVEVKKKSKGKSRVIEIDDDDDDDDEEETPVKKSSKSSSKTTKLVEEDEDDDDKETVDSLDEFPDEDDD